MDTPEITTSTKDITNPKEPLTDIEDTAGRARDNDRVGQRPHLPGCARPWALPQRAGRLKCVYLAVMALDPTGTGRKRWATRWKAALNAFEITFEGRLSAGCK